MPFSLFFFVIQCSISGITGEVPCGGDGTLSEGSSEVDDHNGEDSDEEDGKVHRHSPDGGDIVTPSNFDSHMAAQVGKNYVHTVVITDCTYMTAVPSRSPTATSPSRGSYRV